MARRFGLALVCFLFSEIVAVQFGAVAATFPMRIESSVADELTGFAQNSMPNSFFTGPSSRPLSEVLAYVGECFDVRIVCKRIDADTVSVAWAPFRIRPYSLAETLDNVTHPLDLVWKEEGARIVVQPYEYYRRTVADGEKLLAWLSSSLYGSGCLGTAPRTDFDRCARGFGARIVFAGGTGAANGCCRRGVAAQRLYDPKFCARNVAGALCLRDNLCSCGGRTECPQRGEISVDRRPSGHWTDGRYRADHQYLMADLARMGTVAVDMDIFGWGESERQVGREAHTASYAMQIRCCGRKWSRTGYWRPVVTSTRPVWRLRAVRAVRPMRFCWQSSTGGLQRLHRWCIWCRISTAGVRARVGAL